MDTTGYLGREINVVIDRPLGSKHPKYGFIYEANYGYIPNTKSFDKDEIDVYILGINKPVNEFTGTCIAIIHRTNDQDDKLIVVPKGKSYTDKEIEKLVKFQEKWFKHEIIRKDIKQD